MESGGRWQAARRGVCPRCRQGQIFASLIDMHATCEVCGLEFDREPGYFAGAMYISYAMAIPTATLIALVLGFFLDDWSLEAVVAATFVLMVPLSPLIFRYSRIFWIHFDRSLD